MKPNGRKPPSPAIRSEGADLIARARQQVDKAHQRFKPPTTQPPRDLIPGYTLMQEISRGGQGIVYEAVKSSTNQEVAIKIMRWAEVARFDENRRFDREIRILGRLSHPCIVSLHEGGVINDFRYFVMDLVSGKRMDLYARDAVRTRDTLEVFRKVCLAVQSAHLRGIVHRDLKPGNILVDTDGEPHILDFGLAKLIEDDLGNDRAYTILTQTGQFLGSLTWASPEQASGDANKVDVRTDVYALGLILYHALTGRYPYEVTGSTQDVLRTIAETPPTKPGLLCRAVDADLETILLKCLAKEPKRRYQSAGLLARDIELYLDGGVIEARRESRLYVLTKTIRRHRAAAIATLALLAASLGYAATLTVLYKRATDAETLAARNAHDARRALCGATETIGFLVGKVSNRLAATVGQTNVRKAILEGAYERLLALSKIKTDDSALQHELSRVHAGMGEIAEALGDFGLARKHFSESLENGRQYAQTHPGDSKAHAELSICLVKVGDMEKQGGDLELANTYYRRSLIIDESLVAEHPDNTHYLDNLLWSYERLSDLARRRNNQEAAFRLSDQQCELAERLLAMEPEKPLRVFGMFCAHNHRFQLARINTRVAEATEHARAALRYGDRLLALSQEHPYYMTRVAACYIDAAESEYYQLRFADANTHAQLGLDLGRRLVAADPTVIAHQALFWAGHHRLGRILSGKPEPDWPAAYEHYSRSREAIERILAQQPSDPNRWHQLVEAFLEESAAAGMTGRADEARRCLEKAMATARSVLNTEKESRKLPALFARVLEQLWPTDPAELQDALVAAMLVVEQAEGKNPTALYELALLQDATGDPRLALKTLQEVASITDPEATNFNAYIQHHLSRLSANDPHGH